MNKGDIVLISDSQGRPGIRRVWEPTPERPFVCHEEYWARWERHDLEPVCWQVPRDRVFQADEQLAVSIDEAFDAFRAGNGAAGARLQELWAQAKPIE